MVVEGVIKDCRAFFQFYRLDSFLVRFSTTTAVGSRLSILSFRFTPLPTAEVLNKLVELFQFYRLDSTPQTREGVGPAGWTLSILSFRFLLRPPVPILQNQEYFQFYRLDSGETPIYPHPHKFTGILSILSFRFEDQEGLEATGAPQTTFQFYRLDSGVPQPDHPNPVLHVLSILSFRFCALGPPSLSFRFRLRIGLTPGFISFYLGSWSNPLEGF